VIGRSLLAALLVLSGAENATVHVTGPRSLTVTAAELAAMPRTTVMVTSRGQDVMYEGVSMRELLTRGGVPAGEALRGDDLAQAVVVTGADGYKVAFGVAEFDPAFTDRVAVLADRRNGAALATNEAPFQLVLSGEKRAARWVRQVVSIDIRRVGQ
jgi:hypothetical protein